MVTAKIIFYRLRNTKQFRFTHIYLPANDMGNSLSLAYINSINKLIYLITVCEPPIWSIYLISYEAMYKTRFSWSNGGSNKFRN